MSELYLWYPFFSVRLISVCSLRWRIGVEREACKNYLFLSLSFFIEPHAVVTCYDLCVEIHEGRCVIKCLHDVGARVGYFVSVVLFRVRSILLTSLLNKIIFARAVHDSMLVHDVYDARAGHVLLLLHILLMLMPV